MEAAADGISWDQRKIKTQHRQNVATTWCVWWPHERKCVFWFSTAAEGGDIRENVALNYNSGSLAGMNRTLIIYTHSRTLFLKSPYTSLHEQKTEK